MKPQDCWHILNWASMHVEHTIALHRSLLLQTGFIVMGLCVIESISTEATAHPARGRARTALKYGLPLLSKRNRNPLRGQYKWSAPPDRFCSSFLLLSTIHAKSERKNQLRSHCTAALKVASSTDFADQNRLVVMGLWHRTMPLLRHRRRDISAF
jgi:hypothetical protein